MRPRWLVLVIVWLIGAGLTRAQTMAPLSPPPLAARPVVVFDSPSPNESAQVWGSADYLLWWFKSAPLPLPLVTIASSNDPAVGAIGGATTQVGIGNDNLAFPTLHGGRFALGSWLDDAQTVGVEASGFFLASASVRRSASVNGIEPLVISIPFLDVTPGGLFGGGSSVENAFFFGAPMGTQDTPNSFAGIAVLNITDQLWGTEANAVFNLSNGTLRLDLLGGLRYVLFQEKLSLVTSSPTVALPGGVPVPASEYFVTEDHFDGRNDFYAGQLGLRASADVGPLTVTATAKVALGWVHQQLNIGGLFATNDNNPVPFTGPGPVLPGGYFALASNSGEFHRDRFAVVPEVGLTLNYALTPRLTASLGYTFLYLNNVLRPGQQIDRVINAGQSPLYETGSAVPGLQGGPVRPVVLLHETDFWAQGLNFGLEFRF